VIDKSAGKVPHPFSGLSSADGNQYFILTANNGENGRGAVVEKGKVTPITLE